MPHIRAKKYNAMEEKIKLYSEFMTKMEQLTEVQNKLQDEMESLKVKYKQNIEGQDLIIHEENKKEVCNKTNSTAKYAICSTAQEIQEQNAIRSAQPMISWGYRAAREHQPKGPDGHPSQEQQWSCVLGLWVDWRSPLSPMYKRRMCGRHLKGECTLGDRCCFAHGESEIKGNYNIKRMIPIENYNKHKIEMEAKLKTNWDWEKELIQDRIIKN